MKKCSVKYLLGVSVLELTFAKKTGIENFKSCSICCSDCESSSRILQNHVTEFNSAVH
jgi:hypothetical protein